MRRTRPALIATVAGVAAASLIVGGVAVAGTLHDDPAAIGHIDAAIAELNAAKGDLTAPPPIVTVTPPTVTTTATVTPPPVTTTATVPGPTSTVTTTVPGPTVTVTVTGKYDARGIPTGDAVLFGAAVGSNTDPTARESTYGETLGIHRTYWRADQVSNAVTSATADHAKSRLPWLSFKLPVTWESAVAGGADAWASDLASKLGALNKPVWIAIHHEPEGDGDLAAWKAMQRRLAPIFRAQPNIAYSVVLTGYNQWFSTNTSYAMANIWPGDGYFDILGFDPYNNYGVGTNTNFTELKTYYDKIAPFAKAHGVKWAIAETGYTDVAASHDAAWLARAYDDMRAAGGIGLSYFDSTLNSAGTWALSTTVKQQAFDAVLARSDKP